MHLTLSPDNDKYGSDDDDDDGDDGDDGDCWDNRCFVKELLPYFEVHAVFHI